MLSCTGIGICSAFIQSIYLKYPNNNILEINKYNSFFLWLWIRVCLPRRRLPYGSEWRRHTVEVAFTQDCKLLQCCVLLVRSWLPDWGLLCQFLSPSSCRLQRDCIAELVFERWRVCTVVRLFRLYQKQCHATRSMVPESTAHERAPL